MNLKKKTVSATNITELPKPVPHRGGSGKAVLWAILVLLAVGGAAFWLTRSPEMRTEWRGRLADIIDNVAQGTPMAGMGGILREAPPLPPLAVTRPTTAPGTLAGQIVQAPTEFFSGQSGGGEPVPRVTEDSRVRPALLEDLAGYLVSNYRPGPRGGSLAITVQGLNQRYGIKLSNEAEGGRAGILRYVFHPSMLQGLYTLYVERFMNALEQAAAQRSLTAEQTRQMLKALARRCISLAEALEGVASLPDLSMRLRSMDGFSEQAVNLNSQMTEAVFALDALREDKADVAATEVARLRVDGLAARYRRTLEDRAKARRTLVAAIRQTGGQALDEDSLLFVAEWVDRRAQSDGQAQAASRAAAALLRDLARRCSPGGTL